MPADLGEGAALLSSGLSVGWKGSTVQVTPMPWVLRPKAEERPSTGPRGEARNGVRKAPVRLQSAAQYPMGWLAGPNCGLLLPKARGARPASGGLPLPNGSGGLTTDAGAGSRG